MYFYCRFFLCVRIFSAYFLITFLNYISVPRIIVIVVVIFFFEGEEGFM